LKINIRKELLVESINSKEGIPLKDNLARVTGNSKRQYERVTMKYDK
jgi:hypothetical protein